MTSRLAIVAGSGSMPRRLADDAAMAGFNVFILNLDGITDPATSVGLPHATVGVGQIGRAIAILHEQNITDICMIGPVRRPSLSALKLDARGAALLSKIVLRGRGDDALLRTILAELAEEGFRIRGAHEIQGRLLAPAGQLGRHAPDKQAAADLALGVKVAQTLGLLDVGQAVVVQQGQVLGVEGVEGTDRLIERCGRLRMEGHGGVLVKLRKPQQESRADLPTIGTTTVVKASEAGLVGVAIEAEQTLMVDRDATIKACDKRGLFLLGIVPARP